MRPLACALAPCQLMFVSMPMLGATPSDPYQEGTYHSNVMTIALSERARSLEYLNYGCDSSPGSIYFYADGEPISSASTCLTFCAPLMCNIPNLLFTIHCFSNNVSFAYSIICLHNINNNMNTINSYTSNLLGRACAPCR